jgi:vancomycin resistance protein YoaR
MPPKNSQKLIFFIISLIAGLVLFSLFVEFINYKKISHGVSVAGVNFSGLKYETAKNKIDELVIQKKDQTIEISYEDKKWLVRPGNIGINLNKEQTIQTAYSIGRGKNMFAGLVQQIQSLLISKNVSPSYSFDEQKFTNFIQENLSPLETPAKNATLKYEPTMNDFILVAAQDGQIFDIADFKNQIEQLLNSPDKKPILLSQVIQKPTLTSDDHNAANIKAKQILDEAPYELQYTTMTWPIEKQILVDWLEFEPANDSPQTMSVVISQNAVKDFLAQLAPTINKEAVNARLSVQNDKVVAFDLSQEGLELQIDASAKKISQAIQDGEKEIILAVKRIEPDISTKTVDTLGLTSLLAVGTSSYAGSPANRIHNISVGAAKLSGILLKPGEEFSFIQNIGEIEAAQGYLPELVIKNNKTIPEYGGGLCQISTTLFRAAIKAGLKITERFPHAFPVKYYNPQGFDATVYPPHPDLRFINDTPGNLLIQPKIKGTQLTFEIYGTKDEREVKIIGPTILSSNSDGSMKTVLYQEIWRDGALERKDTFRSNYRSPALYPVDRNPLE